MNASQLNNLSFLFCYITSRQRKDERLAYRKSDWRRFEGGMIENMLKKMAVARNLYMQMRERNSQFHFVSTEIDGIFCFGPLAETKWSKKKKKGNSQFHLVPNGTKEFCWFRMCEVFRQNYFMNGTRNSRTSMKFDSNWNFQTFTDMNFRNSKNSCKEIGPF